MSGLEKEMDNEKFFEAINEAAGFAYVKNPDEQNVVRTRDTIDSFLKHQNLLEKRSTSLAEIYVFEGRGAHEINVIANDEFCYAWDD